MSDRFAREVIAGGGSTAIVSAMLNPVDVVKTRRQLEAFRSTTAIEIVKSIYREGGVVALWRPGLIASCSREMVYSGCTKGLYPHVRTMLAGGDAAEPTLPVRVAAASCTGFLGSLGANAFDVVKIRQFATGASDGLGNAMLHVIRTEGLVSGLLLRGASASAPRGASIAVGEVTTYDQTKSYLRRHYEDGFGLHVVTSLITGVVATTVAAPFDLLKSRVMASSNPTDGFVSVLARLLRHEGPLALFNGWWPTYLRLVRTPFSPFRCSRRCARGSGSSICDSVFTHSCAPLQVEYQMESTSAVRPELFEFTCGLSARRVSHTKPQTTGTFSLSDLVLVLPSTYHILHPRSPSATANSELAIVHPATRLGTVDHS